MLIPSYDDAPDLLQGSVPMGGDDPRNDAMFSYVTPDVRLRADQRPRTPPGDPKNPPANFHGQARRNDTHQLTTDPDARLYRKATGREAWGYLGPLLPGNRHGFIIDTAVTEASGTAERDAALGRLVDRQFAFGAAAYNLVRWRNLMAQQV